MARFDVVAQVYDHIEEFRANAKLIAAAPELAEIALSYLRLLESDYVGRGDKDLSGGAIAEVVATLKKAGLR